MFYFLLSFFGFYVLNITVACFYCTFRYFIMEQNFRALISLNYFIIWIVPFLFLTLVYNIYIFLWIRVLCSVFFFNFQIFYWILFVFFFRSSCKHILLQWFLSLYNVLNIACHFLNIMSKFFFTFLKAMRKYLQIEIPALCLKTVKKMYLLLATRKPVKNSVCRNGLVVTSS